MTQAPQRLRHWTPANEDPTNAMQKLLLLSVIIATFWLPVRLERRTGGTTSFRKLLGSFLVFAALYAFALMYVYPRLS